MARIAPACRAAARLLLYLLGFLSLLLSPALLLGGLFAWWRGSTELISNLSVGLVCSLVLWQFVAIFHLNREKLLVPVLDPVAFLPQVRLILDEMGYDIVSATADTLVTRPRFNAFLFGGSLRVTAHGSKATIQGPKITAEILRHRLRLFHHLFRVQSMLQEERFASEALLKRVELCLRVRPEQLQDVQHRVLAPLEKAGEVVCEVHVLVHSEKGLRESTIEKHVRPWVLKNDIPCDIHKHHAKFYEPQHVLA